MQLFDHVNKHTLIASGAALLILVGGFVYYLATEESGTDNAVTSLGESPLEGTLGRELLLTLARLRSTKLDTTIFSDPVFSSLKDFSVEIAPQPVGRRNPFSSFGAGAQPAAAAAAKTPAPTLPKGTAPKALTPPAEEEEFSGFDID